MSSYEKMFEWVDLPQGRVSYVGGKRGRDEPYMTVFAVEIPKGTYYGEICVKFLADRHNFNLEIISFGWLKDEWFGSEPDPEYCESFTVEELRTVQSIIPQAVSEWIKLERRPNIVRESAKSHFMGEIHFREGWALIRSESRF